MALKAHLWLKDVVDDGRGRMKLVVPDVTAMIKRPQMQA
jgi:hypothetical protein